MHLTVPELASLFLLIFAVLFWLKIFPATRAVLGFLGAATIAGAGFVGRILTDIGAWLVNVGGSVTAWAFGTAITGAFFVVAAIVFIHDLHPKGGGASRRTGIIALLLGVSLGAGAALIPAAAPLFGAVHTLMGGIVTALNGL